MFLVKGYKGKNICNIETVLWRDGGEVAARLLYDAAHKSACLKENVQLRNDIVTRRAIYLSTPDHPETPQNVGLILQKHLWLHKNVGFAKTFVAVLLRNFKCLGC
jgi:hypothetical protein